MVNKRKGEKLTRKIESSQAENIRNINYKILRNKGLTRKRKKIDRNPRVKRRVKYEKALKKLKSKGVFYRKAKDIYHGELTGIKDHVIKSRNLL